MLNMIAAIGRLTHTPELRTTTSGKEICSLMSPANAAILQMASARRFPCPALHGARRRSSSPSISTRQHDRRHGSLRARKYQDMPRATTALPMRFRCVRSAFAARKPLTTRLHGVLDEQTESYAREARNAQSAQQTAETGTDDFAVINDDEDLPF